MLIYHFTVSYIVDFEHSRKTSKRDEWCESLYIAWNLAMRSGGDLDDVSLWQLWWFVMKVFLYLHERHFWRHSLVLLISLCSLPFWEFQGGVGFSPYLQNTCLFQMSSVVVRLVFLPRSLSNALSVVISRTFHIKRFYFTNLQRDDPRKGDFHPPIKAWVHPNHLQNLSVVRTHFPKFHLNLQLPHYRTTQRVQLERMREFAGLWHIIPILGLHPIPRWDYECEGWCSWCF